MKRQLANFSNNWQNYPLLGSASIWEWLAILENNQLNELGRDVILSDAMLGYLQYLSSIEASGQYWLYTNRPYKIIAPTTAQMKPWIDAVESNNLSSWVKSQAPNHPMYLPMRKEMLKLLAMPEDNLEIVGTKALKLGSLAMMCYVTSNLTT